MILINPNENVTAVVGIPLCFTASATIVLPQEDIRIIDLPPSGPGWTLTTNDPAGSYWTGGNAVGALVDAAINPLQPFHISALNWSFDTPASPNRFYMCFWGVMDDQTRFYGWRLWKNCGSQSPANCGGPNTDNSRWEASFVVANVVVGTIFVNFREEFRLRSDGVRLYGDWKTGSGQTVPCGSGPIGPCWRLGQFSTPLPQTETFRFNLQSVYSPNRIWWPTTFRGTFVGQVPTTWTTPLGGTLTGTGNNRCFTSDVPGTFQVCVESEYDSAVCVDIEVDDLYLVPVGLNCGDCIFTDQIVEFTSNGGLNGVLSATHGTVIDALTWQAPSTPVLVTLSYTIGGVTVDCQIHVVERLRLLNVIDQEIRGLLPGDVVQLQTNYDHPNGAVTWYNVDCPNIITPDGVLTIPKGASTCFGALDCSVRVVLDGIAGATCANLVTDLQGARSQGYTYMDVRIIVDPVYPTPDVGGPPYIKWKPETPEYLVVTNEFEGGCDETYLRNRVAIRRWMVRYSGLNYDDPCNPVPCCEDEQGSAGGFTSITKSAARLDEFWNLVYGQYGHFTLIEPRTGQIWKNVRFDGTMERDHINWYNIQSRDFTLVWKPCCDQEPAGGNCPHQTIIDNIFPGPPQNLSANTINNTWIQVTWQKAKDNVGIKGYELEIDGLVIDVGHTLTYNHKGLTPNMTYTYRVRAYDFAGNRSVWTAPEIGSTEVNVIDGVDNVIEGTDNVIE